MAETFSAVLTTLGLAEVSAALSGGTQVTLNNFSVGDSNGAYYEPSPGQTALVNTTYGPTALSTLQQDGSNPNWVVATGVIPADGFGGWYVREAGIWSTTGNLFAVAKIPETFKPLLANGAGKDLIIKIILEVSNTSAITLLVDPNIAIASKAYVDAGDLSIEGIEILSTGETGGNKFLREDGDGTCSWQLSTADYADGGEAVGANRTLGNTDNFDLSFLTNNTNRLHIQKDGKVGIGTSTPTSDLHIKGTSPVIHLQSSNNADTPLVRSIDSGGNNVGELAAINMDGIGAKSKWLFQNSIGEITFWNVGDIELNNSGNVNFNNGNVGIGTSTPSSDLHIKGISPAIHLQSSNNADTGLIRSIDSGGNNVGQLAALNMDGAGARATWIFQNTIGRITFGNVGDIDIANTGDIAFNNTGTVNNATLKDYGEALVEANTGTAYTINLQNGNVFELTLTGNTTYTFANPPANNIGGSFTLIQKQDAIGSRTVVWPTSVIWDKGNTIPTISSAANARDVFTFITADNGTTWYGFTSGQNFG